jgi:hypothetical protein
MTSAAPQSPVPAAVLLALFAGSFAGQGARMIVDGHPMTAFVLYLVAAILALIGMFWYKIRLAMSSDLSSSITKLATNAWGWVAGLVLLLFSLSFSPLAAVVYFNTDKPIEVKEGMIRFGIGAELGIGSEVRGPISILDNSGKPLFSLPAKVYIKVGKDEG